MVCIVTEKLASRHCFLTGLAQYEHLFYFADTLLVALDTSDIVYNLTSNLLQEFAQVGNISTCGQSRSSSVCYGISSVSFFAVLWRMSLIKITRFAC